MDQIVPTVDKLKALIGSEITLSEPLSLHTTFKIGGPAAIFLVVNSEDALSAAIQICKDDGFPFVIIGGGSNLLCADEGFDGVVIKLGDGFKTIAIAPLEIFEDGLHIVTVGAGAQLRTLVAETLKAGLVGAQGLAGIPGTVGGALRMNAGLWAEGISQFVRTVTVFNPETLMLHTYANSDIEWSYRAGIPEELGVVVSATLVFEQGDAEEVNRELASLLKVRKAKQPLSLPNAGSVFKNPPGHSAGELIEGCGFKGFSVGGAQVSPLHANFIVNTGGATAANVSTLIGQIKEAVELTYGIILEQEIRILR